jgi:hypothetical protein
MLYAIKTCSMPAETNGELSNSPNMKTPTTATTLTTTSPSEPTVEDRPPKDVRYSANGLFESYIEFAAENKGGIYAPQPQVSQSTLAQEAKAAEEEFVKVIQYETERVKVLAMEENERVMALLRAKEEVLVCPICLEEVHAVCKYYEDPSILACCGTRICPSCEKEFKESGGKACFVCRHRNGPSQHRDRIKQLSEKGSRFGRGWAFSEIADDYMYGRNGKRKNFKKTMQYYLKAAELGNPPAQCQMAEAYHLGRFHDIPVQQSTERAMELATASVDQGYANAKTVLGNIIQEDEFSITSESYRLWSIGAYQGNSRSMMHLEHSNARRYDLLKVIANKTPKLFAEERNCALTCVYWSLKASEEREEDDLRKANLYMAAQHMDIAARLWHPRTFFDLEPLTGYSHVPFTTYALKKGMKDEQLEHLNFIDTWKHICANCGKSAGGAGDAQKLMACARCKAFNYCSKECQVKHWKAGHKVDCKAHWIEKFFPNIRKVKVTYSLRR